MTLICQDLTTHFCYLGKSLNKIKKIISLWKAWRWVSNLSKFYYKVIFFIVVLKGEKTLKLDSKDPKINLTNIIKILLPSRLSDNVGTHINPINKFASIIVK